MSDGNTREPIQSLGIELECGEKRIWTLEIHPESVPSGLLALHLDLPFISLKRDGMNDATPKQLIDFPCIDPMEYSAIKETETSNPIEITKINGNWLIVNGLRSYIKLRMDNVGFINVRKIPKSF